MADELSGWLNELIAGRAVPPATARVVEVLRANPEDAAFATVRSIAETAQVNIATVTRTGQFLGYSGWPAFVLDYRGHYLATLRAGSVLAPNAVSGAPPGPRGRVHRDARALEAMAETLDESSVQRSAERLRGSRRILVLATGMYTGPALQLMHNCQLLGYDAELPLVSASTQLNAVDRLGPEDTLVVFTIWKTADIVFRLTRYAHARGVPIMAFTDRSTPVSALVDFTLTVPSEGTSYLPSAVPVVSAVQVLLSTLADIDPERSRRRFAEVDQLWTEMGIVKDD